MIGPSPLEPFWPEDACRLNIRKMFLSAFSQKTNDQYYPWIITTAEELCADWAAAGQIKGEHAMKAFTGSVHEYHDQKLLVVWGKHQSLCSSNMVGAQ